MLWRHALLGLPVLLLLAACGPEPAPIPTPKTTAEACTDLERAVSEFYDAASPNSTITALDVTNLPELNGFRIPRPSCSFEVRPDPAVVAGDVFTIENFYLDYDETMTLTLKEKLEEAGYRQADPDFMTWSSAKFGKFYSASILLYSDDDGQAYTDAADGRVLDLSIGQG
jgi:hypothetical protein